MKLTEKQERFCQALVAGETQRAAYRIAYPSSKKWLDKTVDSRASDLANNRKILGRCEELRKPIIEKARYSLEEHVDFLRKLAILAAKTENVPAATTAEHTRGKALGFYTEKVDLSSKDGSMSPKAAVTTVEVKDLSDDELNERIERIQRLNAIAAHDSSGD